MGCRRDMKKWPLKRVLHMLIGRLSECKYFHIYTTALVVSLCFLVFGLVFVRTTTNLSREQSIGYIQNAVQQTKFAIDQHIRDKVGTLMAAAVMAQDRDLLSDDPVLDDLMKSLNAYYPYVQVGFATADGEAVWIDYYGREHRADLSGEGFIARALQGEAALSRVRYDVVSGKKIHYHSVPIYDGKIDVVEGVLFAADPQDELRQIVDNFLYAGKGLAHIIDSEGSYIVKSNSPLVLSIGDDIYALPMPINEEVKCQVQEDLAARKAGHLVEAFYGENRLIAYAPLEMNDWHVFYSVPETMISGGLRAVTGGAIAMVGIATAIFIFFILLIYRVNSKHQKALENLAFVDPVTRQHNYNKFVLDAERILKNADGARYAMCCFEIKGFKYINDRFGRDVGDRMLRYLAEFQDRVSQEGEASGRIGEDTFAALRKFKSRQEIGLRFEGAAQQLALFPDTLAHGYKAELHGGAYLLNAEDGELTVKDMLDRAVAAQEELALAQRFGIYSREMRERKLWESEMESRMEAALENEEFQVYFQPQIDIQQGDRLCGAEALVRWAFPGKGLMEPGHFIGLFERNGFIVELDKFVFERACQHYKAHVLDGGYPAYVLSVNVSRLGLMRPEFIRTYTDIRESYGIPPGCIELEFTEGLACTDHALFQEIVSDCKLNGFLCAMDDFGAGYSSLNILKSIDVDVLKLDRQFFVYEGDGERGQTLLRNIIAMAKALDMKTVAEGIDREEQVAQLRAMGCGVVQGYVFSRPIPQEEFKQFAQNWKDR